MSAPRFSTSAIEPTGEQRAIQCAADRSLLIEAAAGTAKTTTLALRLCEVLAAGVDPRHLLVLTFTDTACRAVSDTLRLLAGDEPALSQLRIETFETYAAGVLCQVERIDGSDPVPRLTTAEQAKPHVWAAVAAVSADRAERFSDDLQLPAYGSDSYVGEFLRRTQALKGRLLLELHPPEDPRDTPDYAAEELGIDYSLLRVLRRYEQQRRDNGQGRAAFRLPQDATYDLARLLRSEQIDSADELPLGQFRGVFVDEMHDCNEAMFTVLQALLRKPAVYFCAVGDRHQVIHQHNGADARFMSRDLDLELGRSLRRLPLSVSFRYGAPLARWMARLSGKPIAASEAADTELQGIACEGPGLPSTAEAVALELKRWRTQQRKDRAYQDCAVLLRHPSQSMLIENALHAQGIAYACEGFTSYLRRPEVLFVRCAYAVASGRLDTLGGPATRALIPDALFEITQAPVLQDDDPEHRSVEAFMALARKEARESEQVVARIFSDHVLGWASPPVQQRLRRAIAVAQSTQGACRFEQFLEALDMPRFARDAYVDSERRAEVQRHMAGLLSASRQHDGALAFFGFLQQLDERDAARLTGVAEGKVKSHRRVVPTIKLASAAHVKGLEFLHVLLPYLDAQVFPDARAPLADEKNLFYVAATRARAKLTLIFDVSRTSSFLPAGLFRPQD